MKFIKKFFSVRKTNLILLLLIFLSGLISVYDNVMNVVFYEELPQTEQNPVANWIIGVGGVAGLVQIKAAGTMMAVITMLLLMKSKYKIVIIPVFLFQLGLFCYLTFYTESASGFFIGDWTRAIKLFFEFYQGHHTP